MKVRVYMVAAAAAAVMAACGESEVPTGPSNPAVPSPARVNSVTVTGTTNFFQRGQTQQLTASALLSNGFTENRSSTATWQSDNSGVASVSSSGVVTSGNEGEATISATVDGQRGTLRVRVAYGFRTPNPPPGQRLPRPNEFGTVQQAFAERPDLVARSCQPESGGTGTWEFMDFLVEKLRQKDLRWGYHARRGVQSDPARDEVAYNWGSGPDEFTREAYAWDIMGGHCGPNPTPAWIEVTDLGVMWLSRGKF